MEQKEKQKSQTHRALHSFENVSDLLSPLRSRAAPKSVLCDLHLIPFLSNSKYSSHGYNFLTPRKCLSWLQSQWLQFYNFLFLGWMTTFFSFDDLTIILISWLPYKFCTWMYNSISKRRKAGCPALQMPIFCYKSHRIKCYIILFVTYCNTIYFPPR